MDRTDQPAGAICPAKPPCPCGRGDAAPCRLGWRERALRCRLCGLLVRDPLPSLESLRRWYADDYWSRFRYEQIGPGRENIHAHVLDWLERLCPAKGTLVDVGCGGGSLLRLCRAAGWMGIGFDPSAEAVSHAREAGLEAYVLPWPPCPLADGLADAVTFVNVLDHLHDPFGALQEAWRVLRRDGLLYVRVPNGPLHARLATWLSCVGLGHVAVFHLYGFGRRSLLYHLPRLGFWPVTVQSAPPTARDPYEPAGSWAGRARNLLRLVAGGMDRVLRTCGLGWLAWAPSIEVVAVKTLGPHGR